jgi:methyl-accepting chemotaxis protein
MRKRFKLGTKIFAGFIGILTMMAVSGLIGVVSVHSVGEALHIIAAQETPILMVSGDMALNLMKLRDELSQFRMATSTIALTDGDAVAKHLPVYEALIQEFDGHVSAILEGGTLKDGTIIYKTENAKLAQAVKAADKLHTDTFQPAAMKLIEAGKTMLARDVEARQANEAMDTVYVKASESADQLDRNVRDLVAQIRKSGGSQATLQDLVVVSEVAGNAHTALAEVRIAMEEVVQMSNMADVAQAEIRYGAADKKFDAAVAALTKGGDVDGQRVNVSRFDTVRVTARRFGEQKTEFEKAASGVLSTRKSAIEAILKAQAADRELKAAGTKFLALVEQVRELSREEMNQAKSTGDATRVWSQVLLMSVLGLGIATGLLLAWVLTRMIANPIRRIVEGVTGASLQVASAAEQISGSSQSLAGSTTEQAASLEETASSLEQMANMVRQNADNAQQADLLVKEGLQVASQGGNAMQRMVDAIGKIKTSSDETARIIKTIDEIAFQTNLLALNAAVEAARAGDAGRGFAVVAEEVRNLAQRSAQAAKNTADLIASSQEKSDAGVRVAREVEVSLQEIQGAIQKIEGLVASVAEASREQSKGIEQLNQAVSQMDTATQSNAANAEETASTSEELSSQANVLRSMVQELMHMVTGGKGGNGARSLGGNGHGKLAAGAETGESSGQAQRPAGAFAGGGTFVGSGAGRPLRDRIADELHDRTDSRPEFMRNLSDADFK